MTDENNKAVMPDGTNANTHDAGGSVPGAVKIDADGTTTGEPAGAPTDTSTVRETTVTGHPIASTPTTSTAETDNVVGGSVNVHHDNPNTADPTTGAAKGVIVNPENPASTGVSDPNKGTTGA